MSKRTQRHRAAPPAIYLFAAILAAIAGFGTVYVSFAPSDNGRTGAEQATVASSGESSPSESAAGSPWTGLNKGAMAALQIKPKPVDLPDFTFADAEGKTKSLADFRGKVVILNIWATWCVPCREEMPAFDALQIKLGGKDLDVVAINIDKGGPEKAAAFLEETGATHLAFYTDPTGKLFATLKAVGMPTTLLIDREGREIARLAGPADWASPEAIAVMEAAIGAAATPS
ncbi:MAG TPA: TlpA disulfide reductase family protein [Methyloceanibacter sp.]|nr:TlpA disulfide reductase family protein [Methyloceanibacter sp.]